MTNLARGLGRGLGAPWAARLASASPAMSPVVGVSVGLDAKPTPAFARGYRMPQAEVDKMSAEYKKMFGKDFYKVYTEKECADFEKKNGPLSDMEKKAMVCEDSVLKATYEAFAARQKFVENFTKKVRIPWKKEGKTYEDDAVVAEVGKFLYEAKLKSGVLPQVDFFEMMCKWEMIKCGGDYRQFYKWKFEMAEGGLVRKKIISEPFEGIGEDPYQGYKAEVLSAFDDLEAKHGGKKITKANADICAEWEKMHEKIHDKWWPMQGKTKDEHNAALRVAAEKQAAKALLQSMEDLTAETLPKMEQKFKLEPGTLGSAGEFLASKPQAEDAAAYRDGW